MLIYIAGILDVVVGVLMLILDGTPEVQGGLRLSVAFSAAATILIGLAMIALAAALFRGSATARGLVTVFVTLSLVVDAISYVFNPAVGPAALIQQLVFTAVIVWLLWSGPARRYFDPSGSASKRSV